MKKTNRQGNRALYDLLTAIAFGRKATNVEPASTRDFVSIATSTGFTSTTKGKTKKSIEDLVYIHLNDLVKERVIQTTTPFDGKTPILERRWFA